MPGGIAGAAPSVVGLGTVRILTDPVARTGEILGYHRGLHHRGIRDIPGIHEPLNQAVLAQP
jgi:hypothetical protein